MFWYVLAHMILKSIICASEKVPEDHRCAEYDQFNSELVFGSCHF
jgi:hypothetical protein